LVQLCVRVEQQLKRRTTIGEDYSNKSYSRKEFKREGYSSKSKYERSYEEDRERRIAKESTKRSLSGSEPDIDNILPSINKPCEDVLEEKIMFRPEPNIDIKIFSTETEK